MWEEFKKAGRKLFFGEKNTQAGISGPGRKSDKTVAQQVVQNSLNGIHRKMGFPGLKGLGQQGAAAVNRIFFREFRHNPVYVRFHTRFHTRIMAKL